MNRFFQWLDGDNIGKVETLESISKYEIEYFYNFKSGEVCNEKFISPITANKNDLKNKIMVEVPDPYIVWKIVKIDTGKYKINDAEVIDIPPIEDIVKASGSGQEILVEETNIGKYSYISPNYGRHINEYLNTPLPSYEEYKEIEKNNNLASENLNQIKNTIPSDSLIFSSPDNVVINNSTDQKENIHKITDFKLIENKDNKYIVTENDPVYILVNKCKKHDTNITMDIKISLPLKSIYDVANEFDNGESKFINAILDSISIENIKDSLKDALLNTYQEKIDE